MRSLRSVIQHGNVVVQTQAVLRIELVADIEQHADDAKYAATRVVAVFYVPEISAVPPASSSPSVLLSAGQRLAAPAIVPNAVWTFWTVRAQIEHGSVVVALAQRSTRDEPVRKTGQ